MSSAAIFLSTLRITSVLNACAPKARLLFVSDRACVKTCHFLQGYLLMAVGYDNLQLANKT